MAAAKTITSLELTCPFCGAEDGGMNLDLNNLESMTCSSCDHEFSPAEAIEHLAGQMKKWQAVVAWIGLASQVLAAK
jgi:transcription elongation factor Elf1